MDKTHAIPIPELWARSSLFFALCAYAKACGADPTQCVLRAGRALEKLQERQDAGDDNFSVAIEILCDLERSA